MPDNPFKLNLPRAPTTPVVERAWDLSETRSEKRVSGWNEVSCLAILSLILVLAPFILLFWASLLGIETLVVASIVFAPGVFVLSIVLGWFVGRVCRRNPDVKGLSFALAAVVIGYVQCLFWYFVFAAPFLGLFYEDWVSTGCLYALLAMGVAMVLADGSRVMKYVATGLILGTFGLGVLAPLVQTERTRARFNGCANNLRTMAMEYLVDESNDPKWRFGEADAESE